MNTDSVEEIEENTIVKIREEEEDLYSNDDLFEINSWGADLSFRELITMYEEDELVKPELQRKYVWDKVEASRFIESLLMGLPVPSIFLALTRDERKLIIDGFQRTMSVYDYIKGTWSKDGKVFKLSNSEKINSRWRGKAFSELTDQEQRRLRSTTIHSIIFEQQSPSDTNSSLFQIFERINTGGRPLMAQEIRNCVYQGALNSSLIELNKDCAWRTLMGGAEDSRMRDMEFILRFLALRDEGIRHTGDTKISLKKHLNDFMGSDVNNSEAKINEFESTFLQTVSFILNNIGPDAFYNLQSGSDDIIRKRFYPTVFDSLCVATSIALNDQSCVIDDEGLRDKWLGVLRRDDFKGYISEGTMKVVSIHGRIRIMLEDLYGLQY